MKISINKDDYKSFLLKILAIVLLICLLAYVTYHIINLLTTDVTTTPAYKTSATLSDYETGYIFRDETIIKASSQNNVFYPISSGQKVGVNDIVGKVYTKDIKNTTNSIKSLEEEKALLIECINMGILSSYNTTQIDSNIVDSIIKINSYIDGNDFDNAMQNKALLKTYLLRRQISTSSISKLEERIYNINQELEKLYNQLGDANEEIAAPKSGYFYSTVDGFESDFTIQKLNNLYVTNFETFIETSFPYKDSNAIGKLATTFEWKLAFLTEDKYYQNISVNDIVKVTFPQNSYITIQMTVEKISRSNSSDEILIILRTNTIPKDFNFIRSQEIIIEKNTINGYKVPTQSVRIIDGKKGVYILDGITVKFRQISIIEQIDNYYIVEMKENADGIKWLQLNDLIITSGKNLYDGKIVS